MKRGAFTALATSAVLAPPLRARAQQSAAVRVGSVPVESYALVYYAQEQGFFKRAGLDVTLSTFSGGGAVTAGLAGGSLDVACANVGALSNAHARGLPLAVFAPGAAYTSAAPTTVLAVAKSSPLSSAKDLTGKTVGVSTLRDLQQASVMKWVDANGGDAKTLKFVELSIPQMPAALNAGRLDAGILLEPELTSSKNEVRIIAHCYDAIAKMLMITAHVAGNDWLAKNPAVARRFAGALREAARWANANRAGTAAILERLTKIPPGTIAAMNRVVYLEALDAGTIQPVIDAMAGYKFLPKPFPAAEMFWTEGRA